MDVTFLVDTGSNITILSPAVMEKISAPRRPVLENVENRMILADGSAKPFRGKGTFELEVEGRRVLQEVWVADIELEGILGMDFVRRYGCQIVVASGGQLELFIPKLKGGSVNGGKPATGVELNNYRCLRVVVEDTVLVPANSEMITAAKVLDKCDGGLAILEPTLHFVQHSKLLVGRSLVRMDGPIPICLLNPTPYARWVYKNTLAALCEPVAEDLPDGEPWFRQSETEVRLARESQVKEWEHQDQERSLPLELEELLNRSTDGLDDEQIGVLTDLLNEYQDVFATSKNPFSRTSITQHRIVTGETKPIKQAPRRLPLHLKEKAEEEIEKMLAKGIIEPSSSPWSSPVVLVKKKDGTIRFCIDYRKVNGVTVKDSYPLPRIDDCLDALSGSQWFCTLDLASGYWQVEMEEKDKEKTAFSTGSGLYQFNVMPFGLCNAPATFERLMERVLVGLPWQILLIFLDDVIVHAKTFEEVVRRLRLVFERLQSANLKLSPKKCVLFQKKVTFLGHVVSEDGVSTDPSKTEAVSTWPVPRSVAEVRSFLGLTSYYRRFIYQYAHIAKPLHELTESGKEFLWTEACDKAFCTLKKNLTSTPVLAYPTLDDLFILDTDASGVAIGAVLSQVQNGTEKVIAYFSRALRRAERNYCTTRRELLAVVEGIRHFHHYLYGRKFTVRTDHGALQWLMSFKDLEGQMARWIEILGTYDYEVVYRPGAKHGNADALSRQPCSYGECGFCDRIEAKHKPEGDSFCGAVTRNGSLGHSLAASSSQEMDLWIEGIAGEELQKEQRCDPILSPVISWLESGQGRPKWEQISSLSPEIKGYWAQFERLILKEGILYCKWEVASLRHEQSLKLVIPKVLQEKVLLLLHDSVTAGHLGVKKTLQRVKQRYYWCGSSRDVKAWCRNCPKCSSRRKPQKKFQAPLQVYNVGAPLERLAIDVLGPLPETDQGNRYILVVMDYFSKWVEALAMPEQSAATVAHLLVTEVISRFGVPLQIHTDQGRNFESVLFKEVCRLLDIEKTRTTPLHPQSDGMVERLNRTLEAMLSKFVQENQRNWDRLLPLLAMAYRSAIHESTGCTPNELMFGRDVRLPVDLMFGSPPVPVTPPDSTAFAWQLREQVSKIHQLARDNLNIASRRQKRLYDQRSRANSYREGEKVWLYNPQSKKGRSPKLQTPWEGPWEVTKQVTDVVYRIQKTPRGKPKFVHHDRLKPFHERNLSSP